MWSFDRFAGHVDLGIDYCPGKEPPDAGVVDDRDSPTIEIRAITIPRVVLTDDFRRAGWRRLSLGRCAALVDGNDSGFTVHGAKAPNADSSMRALLSTAGELFVEIEDDRFVSGSASWVKDDHVELWASPEEECVDASRKSPAMQWAIRVADGIVFAGVGPTAGLTITAEAQQQGRVARLKIVLPATLLAGRFSVVYSDSDDGVRQERLIATSPVAFGKWWTLVDVSWCGSDAMEPPDACRAGTSALEPKPRSFEAPSRSGR